MKAPISMCIIVKNEPFLEKCILSFREYVEEIVIVDTGSTDGITQQIAQKYADIFEIYTECNDPETNLIADFSKARQRSFDLATKQYVCWCDSDDIIEGGEHFSKLIENIALQNSHNVVFLFPYEYAYDSNGQCTCRHYRERLLAKDHFHWLNPVHEVLVPNDGVMAEFRSSDEILYKHQRQFSNKQIESGRNLRILRKHYEGPGKDDARQMYYLGLEYCNNGMVQESIDLLIKYIGVSGWDDERCMACWKLVEIYQGLGQYQDGLKWAFKSIEINERWGEGYFSLAKMFYFLALNGGPSEQRNWERCVYFARIGLECPPTKTLLFVNPLERDCEIHKYLNLALNKIGDVKGALESVNTGLIKHNDTTLLNNKKLYETFLFRHDAVVACNKLKDIGELDSGSVELIAAILNKQPISTQPNLPMVVEKQPDKLDIIFFIGDGVEVWTPIIVEKMGIGGSELAAIQISKLLVTLGHRVRVYNSCGNFGEGIYDGVEYYQTHKFQDLECDVLVVSRRADMLDEKFKIKSRLKLLWVHDIYAIAASNQLLLKADRVLALSEWHKQNLIATHTINSNHIITTSNGIDLKRFETPQPRNNFKVVNSSSPDRSWPILLDCWPEIKQQVPEAELHLYYGFKNWEFSAKFDQLQMDLINRLKQQIKQLEPLGVVFHDRVNQDKLAEEFLSAGCWIYPTWFQETSCISAMEATAAGLRMITSNVAALKETVGPRGILIDGEWTSQQYRDIFIAATVIALTKKDDSDRLELQKYAKEHFSWSSVATKWDKMMFDLLKEIETDPIIAYEPTDNFKLGR